MEISLTLLLRLALRMTDFLRASPLATMTMTGTWIFMSQTWERTDYIGTICQKIQAFDRLKRVIIFAHTPGEVIQVKMPN